MTQTVVRQVPCNGCRRCCQGDAVRLLEGEDATQYRTEPHPHYPGKLMLAHKPTGECFYLGPAGCTIHDTKPMMCKEFDCRLLAGQLSFSLARRAGVILVWRKGRELLKNA